MSISWQPAPTVAYRARLLTLIELQLAQVDHHAVGQRRVPHVAVAAGARAHRHALGDAPLHRGLDVAGVDRPRDRLRHDEVVDARCRRAAPTVSGLPLVEHVPADRLRELRRNPLRGPARSRAASVRRQRQPPPAPTRNVRRSSPALRPPRAASHTRRSISQRTQHMIDRGKLATPRRCADRPARRTGRTGAPPR